MNLITVPAAVASLLIAGAASGQLVTYDVTPHHAGEQYLEDNSLISIDISVTFNEDVIAFGLLSGWFWDVVPWAVTTSDPNGFHNYSHGLFHPSDEVTVVMPFSMEFVAAHDPENLDAATWDTGIGVDAFVAWPSILAGDNPDPLGFAKANNGAGQTSNQFLWGKLPDGVIFPEGTTLHLMTLTFSLEHGAEVSFKLGIDPLEGQDENDPSLTLSTVFWAVKDLPGACCTGSSCYDTPPWFCNGRFMGFSTSCSDNLCIPGDLTGDGEVNVFDLLLLLQDWGPCVGCPADLNGDGEVNVFDLLELLANWG